MKGNTSMSNRMLVKPAVDEIYLNNNEKQCILICLKIMRSIL